MLEKVKNQIVDEVESAHSAAIHSHLNNVFTSAKQVALEEVLILLSFRFLSEITNDFNDFFTV